MSTMLHPAKNHYQAVEWCVHFSPAKLQSSANEPNLVCLVRELVKPLRPRSARQEIDAKITHVVLNHAGSVSQPREDVFIRRINKVAPTPYGRVEQFKIAIKRTWVGIKVEFIV